MPSPALHLGRIVEIGPAEQVFEGLHHRYTETLLSTVNDMAKPGRARIGLEGEISSPFSPPPGCVFNTRYPRKIGTICETVVPTLPDAEHAIACHP